MRLETSLNLLMKAPLSIDDDDPRVGGGRGGGGGGGGGGKGGEGVEGWGK